MILSYGKRAVISLLALWLAGCSAPPQTIRTPPDAVYHLDQGDEINIAVSGEQDLTMRVKIDNSGSVDYPYIGSLMLKGKTPEQVSRPDAGGKREHDPRGPTLTRLFSRPWCGRRPGPRGRARHARSRRRRAPGAGMRWSGAGRRAGYGCCS